MYGGRGGDVLTGKRGGSSFVDSGGVIIIRNLGNGVGDCTVRVV